MRWALAICLMAGCSGELIPGGISNQDRLAIEQQRSYVAAVFATSKPYELLENTDRGDDYNGPLRSASPPQPPVRAIDGLMDHSEPAGWRGWDAAMAEHRETGRPILVVVGFEDEQAKEACGPCRNLDLLIAGDFDRFAELGIPCRGVTTDWQKDADGVPLPLERQRAPMLVYVTDLSDPKAVHSVLGRDRLNPQGFVLEDGEAFFNSIKEWLDGLN